jgi:hypothetical protein
MNDVEKEHFLHKIVAISGFLFALCILPVAQYYLVTSKLPVNTLNPNQGQVAGVSTDTTITHADISSSLVHSQCVAQRDIDLANLVRLETGNMKAYQREYEDALAKDQSSIALLSVADHQNLLPALLEQEKKTYQDHQNQLEAALEPQKKAVESRPCPE